MNRYAAGLVAGFVATVVLSAIMLVKNGAELLPQLNVIGSLAALIGTAVLGGWVAHFIIGTVFWGPGYAAIGPRLPGRRSAVRGMVFATIGWLLMMIIFMPLVGAGLFGLDIGWIAPVATLVLHLIFGAVLGYTFAKLIGRPVTTERIVEPTGTGERRTIPEQPPTSATPRERKLTSRHEGEHRPARSH